MGQTGTQKRFWWSVAAVFVVMLLTDWFFHGWWLKGWYEQTSQFWRSPDDYQKMMPALWIGNFIFSWAFVWIYSKGLSTDNPWAQAFRYASAIFLVSKLPEQLSVWATRPYPGELLVRWGFIALFQAFLCAFVVTWTWNPAKAWKSATHS